MAFDDPERFDDGVDGLDGIATTFRPFFRFDAVDLCPFNQRRKNSGQTALKDELRQVPNGLNSVFQNSFFFLVTDVVTTTL